MSEKSQDCRSDSSISRRSNSITVLPAETLRSVAVAPYLGRGEDKSEDRVSLFWRIFGGTLLSIAALVGITLYQQLNNGLNEVRSDVNHLNEFHTSLVKQDEFNNRLGSVWSNIKETQAAAGTVTALKERSALLEQQVKMAEDERKELAREVQRLRERMAVLEGRQSAPAAVAPERVHGGIQ